MTILGNLPDFLNHHLKMSSPWLASAFDKSFGYFTIFKHPFSEIGAPG